MSTATETPSWGDLFLAMKRYILGDIYTAQPGQVVSYDAETGYARVRPDLALRAWVDDTNGFVYITAPIIEEVPVCWPVWGGAQLGQVGQLVPGDRVLLVSVDRSVDEWKLGAEAPINSVDIRRHEQTDAFAIVGGFPGVVGPPASVLGAVVHHGLQLLGGADAADPVVTESRLEQVLAARDAIFRAHTHLVQVAAPPAPPTLSTPPAVGYAARAPGATSSPSVRAT